LVTVSVGWFSESGEGEFGLTGAGAVMVTLAADPPSSLSPQDARARAAIAPSTVEIGLRWVMDLRK
jgi:hypothetical protein